MNFKYSSIFTSQAKVERTSLQKFQSTASMDELKDLRTLAPDDLEVKDNPDLLYVVFNSAVVNLVNANGDGILTDTAKSVSKYFKNKPVNIEHNSKDVIGYINNVGFTSFQDNKVLASDAIEGQEPFNIALSAILWKTVDPFFVQYVEDANNPNDMCYKDVSASWEIGFNDYVVAVGPKNLSKARIVTDPEEIKSYSKYLRKFGGSGFDPNNDEVHLIIAGEARPLGVALTSNPAAAVKGVMIVECEPEETEEPEENEVEMAGITIPIKADTTQFEEDLKRIDTAMASHFDAFANSLKNLTDKISQTKEQPVTHIKSMKNINSLEDLYDCLSEASASNGEGISFKDLRDVIKSKILELNEEWKKKVEAKEQELSVSATSLKEVTDNLAKLQTELTGLKSAAEKQEKQNVLDVRLSKIEEKFNLDDKARKVIAKNILGLSDEAFASWQSEEGEVILAGKEKTQTVTLEEGLNKSVASVQNVPNATNPTQEAQSDVKSVSVSRDKGNNWKISVK